MNIVSSARSDLTLRTLRVSELAERCISEVNAYQNGEHSDELSAMELFRRAIGQRDPVARVAVQQCFNEIMLRWLHSHPQREMACWLDSEEHYVAQGFARFWLATTQKQGLEFQTLDVVLRYLRASLHSALLDTLRAYSRPGEALSPEIDKPGELWKKGEGEGEVWKVIQRLLPDAREQRVAYLLFHCGLKPREILRDYPEGPGDMQEIYRLRRSIVERLLRHAPSLPWQLQRDWESDVDG